MILTKFYKEPPFCESEILRYAGCKKADPTISELLQACIHEVKHVLKYNVCYCEVPVTVDDTLCDFGTFSVRSAYLSNRLNGCKTAILFAATLGVEMDRLIAKYGHLSPAKATLLQAVGAERIEALCDAFCHDFEKEQAVRLRSRFSPGYGDLPLTVQRDLFSVLNCEKYIGLTLTDHLLMSPTKSVTAIVGIDNY